MKTIYIDSISSISESTFSFKYKTSIVENFPFKCKQKEQKNGSSSYHFDKDDLNILQKQYPEICEYNRAKWSKKNDYIEYIREVFTNIISKGEMVQVLSTLYGRNINDVEIRWAIGEVWVNVDIRTKTCTIHKNLHCAFIINMNDSNLKGINVLRQDGGWLSFESLEEGNLFCHDQYSGYRLIVHC
jgi:hypothetical protein